MTVLRVVNLVFSGIGFGLFFTLLIVLTQNPDRFNEYIKDIAVAEVSDRFHDFALQEGQGEKLEQIKSWATQLSDRFDVQIADTRAALESGVDEFVANVLIAHCRLDCEQAEQARVFVEGLYKSRLASLEAGKERIEQAINDEFSSVLSELRADVSLFSGANSTLFLAAFLLALFKGRASVHLLPVSLSLIAATAVASSLYLFQQDWLQTVLFNSYWGGSYLFLVGILACALIDIALNKGRITTQVLNFILNAVGSAASVLPC